MRDPSFALPTADPVPHCRPLSPDSRATAVMGRFISFPGYNVIEKLRGVVLPLHLPGGPAMTLVAVSAAYGAAGSHIAPAVAQRLGVPFVDRAIPLAVADHLDIPVEDALAHEARTAGSLLERLLSGFRGADTGAPTPLPPDVVTPADFHRATRDVLLARAATGDGVILGRGAVAALRDDPRALRVRLTGPVERRIAQAVRLGAPDRETAERAMRQLDRAHADYLRQFYEVDIDDPSLYHLVVDATAFPSQIVVDLVASAAVELGPARQGRTSPGV